MATTSLNPPSATQPIRGKILEAEVKISVDPGQPLPLACGLYAVEMAEGVWLCAYYGTNKSVFDYLPQKGAEVDESRLGITFHSKEFIPQERYQPARWEEFKKAKLLTYGAHGH